MRDDICVVMNQVRSEREGLAVFEKIQKVAAHNIGPQLNLEFLGKVSTDQKVSISVKQRALFTEEYPSSQPSRDIEAISAKIEKKLEHNVLVKSNDSGLSGLFKRLMEHF